MLSACCTAKYVNIGYYGERKSNAYEFNANKQNGLISVGFWIGLPWCFHIQCLFFFILSLFITVVRSGKQGKTVRFHHVTFDTTGESFLAGDHHGNIYVFDISRNRWAVEVHASHQWSTRTCICVRSFGLILPRFGKSQELFWSRATFVFQVPSGPEDGSSLHLPGLQPPQNHRVSGGPSWLLHQMLWQRYVPSTLQEEC